MPYEIPQRPTPESKQLERAIRALIHRVDPSVRLYFQRTNEGMQRYSWNGRTLRPATTTYESYLHDVAHWLVATKAQRKQVEFGLGPDPYRLSNASRTVTERTANRIETETSLLQTVLVLAFGLNVEAVAEETQYPTPTLAKLQRYRQRKPHLVPRAVWENAEAALRGLKSRAIYKKLTQGTVHMVHELRRVDTQLVNWRTDIKNAITTLTDLATQLQQAQQGVQPADMLRQLRRSL